MSIPRTTLVVILLSLGLTSTLIGEDDVATQFREAMSSQNAQDKQAAVAAAARLPDRDQAYALLLQATEDRQARRHAFAALASLSGVTPRNRPDSHGNIGSGYPNHPEQNTPQAWAQWISTWRQEEAQKQRMVELQQAVAEAQALAEEALQADKEEPDDTASPKRDDDPETDQDNGDVDNGDVDDASDPSEDADDEAQAAAKQRPLDRIIFTNGGTLVGHVITRRIDLDGQLTSVVIEHRDGGGREVIDAALIARIEDGAQ